MGIIKVYTFDWELIEEIEDVENPEDWFESYPERENVLWEWISDHEVVLK